MVREGLWGQGAQGGSGEALATGEGRGGAWQEPAGGRAVVGGGHPKAHFRPIKLQRERKSRAEMGGAARPPRGRVQGP